MGEEDACTLAPGINPFYVRTLLRQAELSDDDDKYVWERIPKAETNPKLFEWDNDMLFAIETAFGVRNIVPNTNSWNQLPETYNGFYASDIKEELITSAPGGGSLVIFQGLFCNFSPYV